MSKKYPECPLQNHANCRDCFNPKLCAIVREDKVCLKKRAKSGSKQLKTKTQPYPTKEPKPQDAI
jgi:hypothetical protein